jgi:hydrogenase maturation protease
MDLRQQLCECLEGRVCLVGLGNVDQGDDGLGVRLAESLLASDAGPKVGSVAVVIAGSAPERCIGQLASSGFDHVVFLDATQFGGSPGSVVLLNAREMSSRFPQVSTHRISLGLLAQVVEAGGATRAWLLGVEPDSLASGSGLSMRVQATVDILAELLGELTAGQEADRGPAPVGEEHCGREEAAC